MLEILQSALEKISPYVAKWTHYASMIPDWFVGAGSSIRKAVVGTFEMGGLYAGAMISVAILGLGFAIYKLADGMDNTDNNDGLVAIVFIMALLWCGIAYMLYGLPQ